MFLRGYWYAAGWSRDFSGSEIRPVMLLDEPIVFYRQTRGRLVALEDRCCHRLAPLSMGRVEGDDLRCMYHGLKFDCSGQCIEIPGQPRIPPQTRVRSYPVIEKHSLAWIWMGDPTQADEALIPPCIGLDEGRYAMLPGRMDYRANFMLISDNLLDLSHVSYVHRNSFGSGDAFAETRPKLTRLDNGLRVERWLVNSGVPKYLEGIMPPETRSDVWNTYDFLLPGVLLMHTSVFPVGAAERFGRQAPSGDEDLVFKEYTCQAVTPLTSKSSCYFFAYGPWSAAAPLASHYHDVANKVFGEDRVMIESQQRVIDLDPTRPMQAASSDAGPNQFRWLFDKKLREEQAAAGIPIVVSAAKAVAAS